VGDSAPSRDEAGSGIEPAVTPKVRRAFGLLERFAPALGARWAVELWCTPPAVEMSLRMPPGVPAGEPIEANWSGHRIAGEFWGDGPSVYLVHGWGGCRAHLGVFVKPLVDAGYRVFAFDLPSHNDSDPGDLAPGRTTIVECAEAVRAFEAACIVAWTDDWECRCSTQTFRKRWSPSTIRRRSCSYTTPTIPTVHTRRARRSSTIGETRSW
jgi:hypothetical protein